MKTEYYQLQALENIYETEIDGKFLIKKNEIFEGDLECKKLLVDKEHKCKIVSKLEEKIKNEIF